jgi:hypothetical protein
LKTTQKERNRGSKQETADCLHHRRTTDAAAGERWELSSQFLRIRQKGGGAEFKTRGLSAC